MTYINVMNRISIDCDCNGNPAEPDIHDIGIFILHFYHIILLNKYRIIKKK